MNVDVRLSIEVGDHYRSASQKARVTTEAWVKDNLYSLGRRGELPLMANTKVYDFHSGKCRSEVPVEGVEWQVRAKARKGSTKHT
ncbi:MAG: DpnI domain-containing protein [Conexivisphaerales archaeon]|jgi:hypothetical protein